MIRGELHYREFRAPRGRHDKGGSAMRTVVRFCGKRGTEILLEGGTLAPSRRGTQPDICPNVSPVLLPVDLTMAMGAGAGGDMGGHEMGMMAPPPASSPAHPMGHGMMHMTFFWGQRAAILFSGWPGDRGLGMYLLALAFVLVLAVLEEALSAASQRFSWRQASGGGSRGPAEALLLTALHAVRLGLAYLVMLALMSFNGGVFLAAVVGHAIGFLFTRSGLLERQAARSGNAQQPPSAKLLPLKERSWSIVPFMGKGVHGSPNGYRLEMAVKPQSVCSSHNCI
ncbi:hypothetical protein ZIOFF_045907 [Zingiber officinale]|uniref:Copper transport protein n=1 Tax=Zingiber officinale TaxID=94328 RepID=A0A8J5G1U2_ZINOF|nr:hypothetical protein ZIOFF_045907 [Zingiber officinale]